MSDLKEKFNEQKERFNILAEKLKLDQKTYDLKELEAQTAQPGFWNDQEAAQQVVRKISSTKDIVDPGNQLKEKINQVIDLLELAGKEDEKFLAKEAEDIESQLIKLEKKTYLSGEYDSHDAIISIHAGQGGTEAMDWTEMLFRMYTRYVESQNWKWSLIDQSSGEEAGLKSVTFRVDGNYAYGYLRREAGTHRLVRQSPFNADNLRQTSFALVEVLPVLGEVKDIQLDPSEVETQFFRSSSQGGQNVQKVSTAVRLVHKPTGIVVESQTQRYQEQNRKIAEELLKSKLWQRRQEERDKKIDNLKGSHRSADWGTQIRSYVLHPYKMVKDLRTDYEEKDPDAVLDGNLTGFIEAELSFLD